MRARPASFALLLAASWMLATTARGETPRPPPEILPVLVPYAPGAYELSLATPAPAPADRSTRGAWNAGPVLLGMGAGACGLWISGVGVPLPARPAVRAESAVGFALTSAGAIGVLAGTLFPGTMLTISGLRALVVLGPGGGGLALSARF